MANIWQGVIIGAAAAAIGTIVATKLINLNPEGNGEPRQASLHSYTARHGGIRPRVPSRIPAGYAPIAQNTPITEAAYNLQLIDYAPTLGPEQNTPNNDLVLPV